MFETPRSRKYLDAAMRFESNVEKTDGCWLWTASKTGIGYGQFSWGGKRGYAHRYAYEVAYGPVPAGAMIMHICDNPSCVNPAHLRLGTQADNLADMYAKGRDRKASGTDHGLAVLSPAKAMDIYADPRSHAEIAREYGIGKTTVRDIKIGRSWRHVTGHRAA